MNGLTAFLYSLSLISGYKTVTSPSDSVSGSLRAVIESAAPGDTVRFSIPDQDTLALNNTLLIKKEICIDGRTNSSTGKRVIFNLDTLKGAMPAMDVGTNRVMLKGMEIRGGLVAGPKAKLHLDSVVVRGARSNSAGIKSQADSLVLSNCLIASNAGGGVDQVGGILIIEDSKFINNKRTTHGAGIYLDSRGSAFLRNSTWLQNRSDLYGGAIYNSGKMEIHGCDFGSNFGKFGGAIGNSGSMHIGKSNFRKNQSSGTSATYRDGSKGGAIYNKNDLVIEAALIDSNSCHGPSDGGYLSGWGGIGFGGAIHNEGRIRINRSSITRNGAFGGAAGYGGDAFGGGLSNDKEMLIENSLIRDNKAEGMAGNSYGGRGTGGGIYNKGRLNILNSTIVGNGAKGNNGNPFEGNAQAGGISNSSYLGLAFSTLSDNWAWVERGENRWGPFPDDIGNGDSIALVNTIVFGKYADSVEATGKAMNSYVYFGRLPVNSSNSLTNISAFELFGKDRPNLEDNGGPTLTIAIDELSVARGSGIPVGFLDKEETVAGFTWKYSTPTYFNGLDWRTVEKDSVVASGSVRPITQDQRGFTRPNPPSRGAFEYGVMTAIPADGGAGRNSSLRYLGLRGNRVALSLPEKAEYLIFLFDMQGRLIFNRKYHLQAGRQTIELTGMPPEAAFVLKISGGKYHFSKLIW